MKNPRLLAGLVLAGLPGLTALSLVAPAEAALAARTMATTASTPAPSTKVVVVGEELEFRGIINATDPATGIIEPAKAGTVLLQVMSSKETTWRNVGSNGFPNQYHYPDIAPQTNSTYRVVYLGYTGRTTLEDSYLPSESGTVTVGVKRKITLKTRDLTVKGKVGPDFAKKTVTVLSKVGGTFKVFKRIRTDARGAFKVTFTARRAQKVKFAVETPADKHFVATRVTGEVVDY